MSASEAYLGLARKYRPQNFDDLVGQEAVADGLTKALEQGRVVHGHLMAGPRGTGKTSTARILARALNCAEGPTATPCGKCRHCIDIAAGNDMDVIEIDGASNNGVENIRELRERVNLAPFSARHKVYIIDEVHMLSPGAFNALLKTLEEPPAGVVFVLATTEMEKVPETIRSRCLVHQFRRLTTEDIARRLGQVAVGERVQLAPEAAREIFGHIARSVDGGMRDALVTLDQLLALTDGHPTAEAAIKLLGLADPCALSNTIAWIVDGRADQLLRLVDDLVGRGRNLERLVKELVAYLRDLMLLQAGVADELVALTGEPLATARELARALPPATLYNMLNQFFALEERLKQSTQSRFLLEFTLLRLAQVNPVVPLETILERIQSLPEAAFEAAPRPATAPPPPAPERPVRSDPTLAPEAQPAMQAVAAPSPSPRIEPKPDPELVKSSSKTSGKPAPPSAAVTSGDLATLDHKELVRSIVAGLPEATQGLFGRYLLRAGDVAIDGHALRVSWDPADPSNSIGRRIFGKPDNIRLMETTLEQLAGRPMKLVCVDLPAGSNAHARPSTESAEPEPPARPARPSGGGGRRPVMADSHPDGDDDDEPPSEAVGERAMRPAAAARPAAAPADGRTALQRAQAFIALDEEAPRRMKLMREMFQGRLIDETGRPLAM